MSDEQNNLHLVFDVEVMDSWTIVGAFGVTITKDDDGHMFLAVMDLFRDEARATMWDISPGKSPAPLLLDATTFLHMALADVLMGQGRLP